MRLYEFKLNNNDTGTWQLKTDKTLEEVKKYVEENKWITLKYYQYKERDIQTCNILYIYEDENYQKRIDEYYQSKKIRLEIIHKIEKYKFNLRMEIWFTNISMWIDKDEELEHPYLAFNEKFLNEVLDKCKRYNCKLK